MEQRNIIIAAVISIAIIFGFQFLYEMPRQQRQQELAQQQAAQQPLQPPAGETGPGSTPGSTAGSTATAPALPEAAPSFADRATALAQSARVKIDTPRLSGSISLKGARIDDLVLKNYRLTIDDVSPNIILLSPQGTQDAYYADFGWLAGPGVAVPGPDTVWQADGDTLTPARPVTLSWSNGQGLTFRLALAVDQNYMFTATQKVENGGAATAELFPFGVIRRSGTPPTQGLFILHEGMIGVLEGTLKETNYDDIREAGTETYDGTGGWLGITDKYWEVALVPDQAMQITGRFAHTLSGQTDIYQADYRGAALSVAPGGSAEAAGRLFAGAKEVRLIDSYRDALGIPLFDRSVDFAGYLGLFLTLIAKPLFYLLDYIFQVVGNFGVAILLLTVLVKLAFFPLANKSYRAMSRMKLLTPEMTKLRERFKDDKARLNQEMMALYKREKVNPAAGCLPILVQIPVFIALYQVLFVTIEMRHAPFFGWIQDLSARDPTSIINLFGLLPFAVPDLGPLSIISIGVWPIVMGITMFVQQKLNPAPPDPVQARIFMMLPIVFTFMLGQFAAGLVIYWAWNNTLSIAQQRLIMWRMGVKP
jgi:YidC/Oxa1 family membrane protein insertase